MARPVVLNVVRGKFEFKRLCVSRNEYMVYRGMAHFPTIHFDKDHDKHENHPNCRHTIKTPSYTMSCGWDFPFLV